MVNGNGRIARVAERFGKMLREVRDGIRELDYSKAENNRAIKELEKDNAFIDTEIENARRLEAALAQFAGAEKK